MTQPAPIAGLHHVTAIASDPQANLDFWAGVLGLRLVKTTVNFDDPRTYHLYYGDAVGSPGSIVTFFPWPGARRGVLGAGQASSLALAVPMGSLDAWRQRLTEAGIESQTLDRFGTEHVAFRDPDGLRVELAAIEGVEERGRPWRALPPSMAVRWVHSVTLDEARREPTERHLADALGLRQIADEGGRGLWAVDDDGSGGRVEVRAAEAPQLGRLAAGSIHHIAWRNLDDADQASWSRHLFGHAVRPTDVQDRQYFHSIYFREPGGVLFEMATDPPGFALDEPVESLGERLMLPPWMEPRRADIESALPPLHRPQLPAPDDRAGDGAP
ncbi:MAG: ring-cleaving dioxygenase [Acidobacteriota bacterium]